MISIFDVSIYVSIVYGFLCLLSFLQGEMFSRTYLKVEYDHGSAIAVTTAVFMAFIVNLLCTIIAIPLLIFYLFRQIFITVIACIKLGKGY